MVYLTLVLRLRRAQLPGSITHEPEASKPALLKALQVYRPVTVPSFVSTYCYNLKKPVTKYLPALGCRLRLPDLDCAAVSARSRGEVRMTMHTAGQAT
jgi:hypothetical protein